MGTPLSDDEVAAMIEEADLNGDGVIDYSEFRLWWGSKKNTENNVAI